MKLADTISVNPSKSTLGHVESTTDSLFRSNVLRTETTSKTIDPVNVLFPTMSSGVAEYRKYEVPLRTIMATILIVTGIENLTGAMTQSIGVAICTICFGAFLAFGLFTRIVMGGASIYYCIAGALALRAGTPDMMLFALMFGCLIFCVTGSGKYSCDTLIRKSIRRHIRSVENKNREKIMGYKAFHAMR